MPCLGAEHHRSMIDRIVEREDVRMVVHPYGQPADRGGGATPNTRSPTPRPRSVSRQPWPSVRSVDAPGQALASLSPSGGPPSTVERPRTGVRRTPVGCRMLRSSRRESWSARQPSDILRLPRPWRTDHKTPTGHGDDLPGGGGAGKGRRTRRGPGPQQREEGHAAREEGQGEGRTGEGGGKGEDTARAAARATEAEAGGRRTGGEPGRGGGRTPPRSGRGIAGKRPPPRRGPGA